MPIEHAPHEIKLHQRDLPRGGVEVEPATLASDPPRGTNAKRNPRAPIQTPTTKAGTSCSSSHARHRPDPEGGGRRLRRSRHRACRFGFDTVRQVDATARRPSCRWSCACPAAAAPISRALDTSADGVIVPIVSSVEQAKAVLDAAEILARRHARRGAGAGPRALRHARRAAGAALRRTERADLHHPAGRGPARRRRRRRDRSAARRRHAVARPQRPLGGAGRARRLRPSRFPAGRAGDDRRRQEHGGSVGRLSVDARQGAAFAAMGYDFVAIAGDVWLLQQAFATASRRSTILILRRPRSGHLEGWRHQDWLPPFGDAPYGAPQGEVIL